MENKNPRRSGVYAINMRKPGNPLMEISFPGLQSGIHEGQIDDAAEHAEAAGSGDSENAHHDHITSFP